MPPEGGLPSRVPQILIDLVCVCVCLSVRILEDFYRRADAPASNPSTILCFERSYFYRSRASGVLRRKEAKVGTLFFDVIFATFTVFIRRKYHRQRCPIAELDTL